MSNTIKCALRYTVRKSLENAALECGATVANVENYRFFDGKKVSGTGVQFPGWKYMAVVDSEGEMFADTYGPWAKGGHLEKFTKEYMRDVAFDYALEHGWLANATDAAVTINTPQGDIVMSYDGTVDFVGGVGLDPHQHTRDLASLLGQAQLETVKQEAYLTPVYEVE